MSRSLSIIASIAALLALLFLPGVATRTRPTEAGPVLGFLITVNTPADEDVNNSVCSLREAIVAASVKMPDNGCSTGGAVGIDTIQFNIGTGTPVINITSNLPLIAGPVVINGNSGGATRVELRGPGTGNLDGLIVDTAAAGSVINRLVINGFAGTTGGSGIIVGAANVSLTGNYIGTDATGTSSLFNTIIGIRVTGAGVHIGGPNGTTPGGACTGDCNLISGNTIYGVRVESSAINALIEGNFVGTDASGTATVGGNGGIVVLSPGSIIGGQSASRRNLVSGNNSGMTIGGGNIIVEGNYVGTDTTGTTFVGNSDGIVLSDTTGVIIGGTNPGAGNLISGNQVGIQLFGAEHVTILGNQFGSGTNGDEFLPNNVGINAFAASNNTIGGTGPGEGNVIQSSNDSGVVIGGGSLRSVSISVRGNSIHDNNGQAIELIDADDGPSNDGIQPPVIFEVTPSSARGTACSNCTIDVYSDDEDEGETYQGTTTANGAGNWNLNGSLVGPHVTATATDAGNNTSEFSEPRTVPFPTPTPSPTPSPSPTPTVTPTSTSTPTPTPTPTATPPASERTWGDGDCGGVVNLGDAIGIARHLVSLPVNQEIGCADLGSSITLGGEERVWQDIDCSGAVSLGDAIGIARFLVSLPVNRPAGCPSIGETVLIS